MGVGAVGVLMMSITFDVVYLEGLKGFLVFCNVGMIG